MESENYLSLFDYLGRAAGSELGLEVEEAASKQNITIRIKQVTTKTYSGKINMYPKEFLDSYFSKPTTGTEILYNEPDNLPIDYSDELPF